MTMGILSDISAGGDICQNCGRLLSKHFGGKHTRRTLREYDGDVVYGMMVDIRCRNCGCVSEIFWQAWLPTTPNMRRLIVECEPTTRRQFACASTM